MYRITRNALHSKTSDWLRKLIWIICFLCSDAQAQQKKYDRKFRNRKWVTSSKKIIILRQRKVQSNNYLFFNVFLFLLVPFDYFHRAHISCVGRFVFARAFSSSLDSLSFEFHFVLDFNVTRCRFARMSIFHVWAQA